MYIGRYLRKIFNNNILIILYYTLGRLIDRKQFVFEKQNHHNDIAIIISNGE